MKPLLALCGLLAMQFAAIAQEEFRAMDGRPLAISLLPDEKISRYNELTATIRIPFLGGSMSNMGDNWTDFFASSGVGIGLDGSYLWSVSSKVALGVYTSLAVDFISGKSVTVATSSGPVTEDFDDLVTTRFMFGGRIRETFGRFFMDQNIGIGFANIGSVDADVGGVTVGVIDDSTVFAFEMGLRLGVVVSRVVDLGMSLMYYYNGAPTPSSALTAVLPGLKLRAQSDMILGFFININF